MTTKMILALAGAFAVCSGTLAQPKDAPKKDAPPPKMEPKKDTTTAEAKDIVDTAMATGMHKTFVDGLKHAGWAEKLKGKGPFTVFAPTDDGFKKLPAGTLDTWMKPENKNAFTDILKFHVIEGASVMAADVVKMTESKPTLQGTTFKITVKDGKVSIGNGKGMANVTKTDVKCSNGVIHVIDAVLQPEGDAKPPKPAEPKKDDGKKGGGGK